MPRPKRYRLVIDFDSIQDMEEWAKGTEKRPSIIQRQTPTNQLREKQQALIKTYQISAFLDQDAPEEKDLHPIAQGIRMSRLG